MKRILHLIDTRGPGGGETVFLSILESLGPEWESVPVVAGSGWVEDSLRSAGFAPLSIPSSGTLDHIRKLTALIRRESIDLVHTHFSTTAFYASIAGRLSGVPVVSTFHGAPDLRSPGWKGEIQRRVIRGAGTTTVCVSRSLKKQAVTEAGFAEDRIDVIYNGIDADVYRPGDERRLRAALGGGDDTLLVGSVGNVRTLKDYPNLVRAARVVKDRGGDRIHFLVVGEQTSPLYDEILALRSELGVDETVTFLGFREDVPDFLRAVDLFALSSSLESFSLVTVQAMATGLPVVATRCGGPEEIVSVGEDGLLCPPGDPEALASSILQLASDRELRARLGSAARKKAESRFSQSAMVRAYEQLYRSLL